MTPSGIEAYSEHVPEKEGTWFGDRTLPKAHRPRKAVFLRVLTSIAHSMGGSSRDTFGYAGGFGCRFANLTICRPPRLATEGGANATRRGIIMPGTTTSQHSPSSVGTLSVEQLFQTAFYNGRTPRSQEYKAGARMALEHRIERKDFDMPYQAGTAAADAYFAGIEEGKTIWRAAVAKIGGAA
ncbi:hypothetical protein PO883_05115 [Massilia sp. DJPM01]|nr:hypothetical protein [Massilia sp. DJPM01]MDM5176575.1 hypothetical protein [Massilia sp. DJPM01]